VGASYAFRLRAKPLNVAATLNSGGLEASGDVFFAVPSYSFETPVLGGQASVVVLAAFGHSATSLGFSASGTATPTSGGGSVNFDLFSSHTEALWGLGDIAPQLSLRSNFGVHNLMAYLIGDIPVGYYASTSLANIGTGHGAIDAGGAYTYYSPASGLEGSATLGVTYNFQNPYTQYQNGTDLHLDLGASYSFNEHLFADAVGYLYKQIGCDIGGLPLLGCFQSQVMGAGPQLGLRFPIAGRHGFLGLKGYKEFAADNRAAGFNVWMTLSISNAPHARN
jgi:hypothetical protein